MSVSESERQAKDRESGVAAQPDGGGRRMPWGLPRGIGASGALFGANGEARKHFLLGLAVVAALCAIGNTSNVLTIVHDLPKLGTFAPIVWEGSSFATTLLFLWIPWLAFRMAPLEIRPLWRIAATHVPAAVAFSVAHVAGFVFVRQAIYWAVGDEYGYGPITTDFPYEFRKDALSYILIIAIFWGVGRILRDPKIGEPEPRPMAGPALLDIRDGAKLTRVRLDDILAVTSADNYVEFILRDERRLMMRKPLSAIEIELGPKGFLRTHRSWLINAAQMTALRPEGSGDYTVELGALRVPLSRRFPDALAKLRAG